MDPKLLSVELPNVGEGPDPLSLNDLAPESDVLVLLLMQSYRSGTCRRQAREVADQYGDFRRVNAQVVVIVPGSRPQVRSWRRLVEPPFPVLADADVLFGEALGQPLQYGLLGRLVDSFGRMPTTVILDCRGDDVSVHATYEGDSSFDRPPVHDVLETVPR